MNPALNAEEILEVAVHIERMGAAYYRRAAAVIENPTAREMLAELAQMEDGHELVFESMRADPDILSVLIGDPEGEIVQYLHAFSAGQIFPTEDPSSALDLDSNIEDVLRHAIIMELKSIAFYQGIKEAMGQNADTRKLDEIVREERSHVTILSRQLMGILARD